MPTTKKAENKTRNIKLNPHMTPGQTLTLSYFGGLVVEIRVFDQLRLRQTELFLIFLPSPVSRENNLAYLWRVFARSRLD